MHAACNNCGSENKLMRDAMKATRAWREELDSTYLFVSSIDMEISPSFSPSLSPFPLGLVDTIVLLYYFQIDVHRYCRKIELKSRFGRISQNTR